MKTDKRYLALAVLSVMAMIVLLFSIRISPARDLDGRYANSPLKSWFDHLASGKGLCCSFADGSAIEDTDWESRDGHYRVRIPKTSALTYDVEKQSYSPDPEMEWIDVPDDAVITEPNLAGRTMVWPIRGYMGTSIRCFMPGSMT